MIVIGIVFISLAIIKHYEPLLLLPIGFGAIVGNMAVVPGMSLSVYDEGSVLSYLYFGVSQGIYPPLIFLGIGAMTDFSTMLSNPKLVLLGAAAQVGIFLTLIGALYLGFTPAESGAIGIIGGADGPPPSSCQPSWPRTCSAPSPSRPTPTWRWCRSSSRPS
jgi:carboxybiotin decarboxylase